MRFIIAAALLAIGAAALFSQVVIGNRQVVTEARTVPAFSSIRLAGSGELAVHRGPQKLEITSDSNVLPKITTKVVGSELVIGFEPMAIIKAPSKLFFEITVPELSGLNISGSAEAKLDPFSGDAFAASISGSGVVRGAFEYRSVSLACSGSGDYSVKVKARDFSVRGSGSSRVSIDGSADKAVFSLSGSGGIAGGAFSAGEASVECLGAGHVEIRAVRKLDASISGAGTLRYWGNPAVSQRISGAGRLSRAGD